MCFTPTPAQRDDRFRQVVGGVWAGQGRRFPAHLAQVLPVGQQPPDFF
jgi:hypothetical protein